MRYKELIQGKLERLINKLNSIKHYSQRGEHIEVNQTIDDFKEELESIGTLLNNEYSDHETQI
jgi:hypothetical protein